MRIGTCGDAFYARCRLVRRGFIGDHCPRRAAGCDCAFSNEQRAVLAHIDAKDEFPIVGCHFAVTACGV